MWFGTLARGGAALTLAALVAGCSADPVGVWQSRQALPNKKRNELEVTDDGGELSMWVQLTRDSGLSRLEYDVEEWFEEADGDFEFRLRCVKGCDAAAGLGVELDFEMDCTHDTDKAWLDCKAASPWKRYGFFEFELQAD